MNVQPLGVQRQGFAGKDASVSGGQLKSAPQTLLHLQIDSSSVFEKSPYKIQILWGPTLSP